MSAAFLIFAAPALIAPALIAQEAGGLKVRLDAIVAAHAKAREHLSKELEGKPTTEAVRSAKDRYVKEVERNTDDVLRLVSANPNDPAVVDALKFVMKTAGRGPGNQSYRAMKMLRGHVREPGMGEVAGMLFHYGHVPVAEELIRAVLTENPNRAERGLACHALAQYLTLQAHTVRVLRAQPARIDEWVHERHREAFTRFIKEADPDRLEKQAEALLERVIAEFADVPDWYDSRHLGAIAEGELFRLRNLSVGKVAPEIGGKDHEGNAFSLSAYRDKVVVLTFSGNWCGPCVGMYPQERELVAKLRDKPFVLLSVNTDARVETLAEAIKSGEITWRCWWDGGTTGPITTRWGILSFPTIFVLDKSGVIRFKDVRGAELDSAVSSLLGENPAEQNTP